MDMMMPVMDGVDACRLIKKSELNKNTMVVFFTANVDSLAEKKCMAAGGDDFILKPSDKGCIVETILRNLPPTQSSWIKRRHSV